MKVRNKVKIAISEPPEIIDPLLSDLAACIARSKRVLVITGAGISCSSGIPDFRSSDGLYNLVKQRHPEAVMKGADMFDAMLFRDEQRTRCFYTFMAELKALIASAKPTRTHAFIQQIQTKGQLLRCYTQNIDCLEEALDLPVVQLHGTMGKVKCTLCAASYAFTAAYEEMFRKGEAPACPQCASIESERARLGKRQLATGTLRPDIVLYNEDHPNSALIGQLQVTDLRKNPDLMIVMGTSLKIPGVKTFIRHAARAIHSNKTGRVIFVNRTSLTKEWDRVFDYEVLGDTDDWVRLMEVKLADTKALAAARQRLKRTEAAMEEETEEEKENKMPRSSSARVTKRTTKAKPDANQTTLKAAFMVSKPRSQASRQSKKVN